MLKKKLKLKKISKSFAQKDYKEVLLLIGSFQKKWQICINYNQKNKNEIFQEVF